MKIKPGYKQTEVGIIPGDWVVTTLGQIGIISGGGVDKKVQPEEIPVRLVNYMDVYRHGFIRSASLDHVVSAPPEQAARCAVCKGDVYFTPSSEVPFDIAVSAVAMEDIPDACYSYHVVRLRLKEDWDLKFRAYAFRTLEFLNQAVKICEGSGVRYVITQNKFRALTVCYPPNKAEQTAIAAVLSDVDSLLDGLDRLVAKKRAIKLATMQQLLTGKTRLSGFRGKREVKQLGEVAEIHKGQGLSKSLAHSSGSRPCILYGELFTTYDCVISKVVGRTDASAGLPSVSGDILMPGSTTTTGRDLAIASALLQDNVSLGGDIIVIRQKADAYDPTFLARYLTHVKKHAIAEQTQGITVHHLYGRNLKDISLELPPLPEQTAIAAVLSDMDAELSALEARREKTRALKYAMIGELLTGKTRLVTPKQKNANA